MPPTPTTTRPVPTPAAPSSAVLNRTLAVVITGSVMAVLDMTIVNVALRSLTTAFAAPLETVQWATTGYTLALAAVIPTAPWAIARIGAKRTYLTALAVFTLGSLLAAGAWDVGSLIAFRAVQGLGGGLLMPVGMTMVMRAADRDHLGRAMAFSGLPIMIGPVLGPVLGGWLVDTADWRWIFLVNLPVGALALTLAARLLHPDAPVPAATAPRLDLPGLLTLSPGLALLLYGLTLGGERGDFTTPGALLPALAGTLLIAAFVRHALTTRQPLLDLRLLRDRTFAASIGVLALFAAGYFGSMLLGPVYWQQVRGFSPTTAGLLGAPVGLTVGLTMQLAARRIDRTSPRRLIPAGITLGALGMALTALQIGDPTTPAWRLVASAMLMGIGAGTVLMPTMTTATRALPTDRLAAAGTALSINSQLWSAVGTALISTLLTTATFPTAYTAATLLLALALLPALRLPGRRPHP
ncbi:DHA2 family efflux MFS transporter permease subunit [Kitasatospora sp. NPDC096147]|uniref:DHA2 family efflux MFS transporter permease subunit n=1 Tax=Kitasatospora sp. NPDC096147 TaxID=3364093 RepID=UPI0038259990